jgi:preprotein translocase subunit SecD
MVVTCGAPNAGEPIDFGGQNQKFCLDRSPVMTEADIVSARLEKAFPGRSVVRLSLRAQASERLRETTMHHVQDQVGVILKEKPLFVATIQEPLRDMYLGPFPDAQAMELVREFNVGNRE